MLTQTQTRPHNQNQDQNTHMQHSADDFGAPRTVETFRKIKILLGAYLGLSALTLVAIFLMRNHSAEVNSAVWIRATIVVASSLLTYGFAVRAARGASRAFLRLKIITRVMVVAIAVIIALPGTFPVWMKIEQGVCGLLLLAVASIVHGKYLRSLFAGNGR